jgi:putative nucleotidyltransferase with HDIG domain
MAQLPAGTIPATTQIAALVHDIGKLIMVRYLNTDPGAVLSLCEDKKLTWVEAERQLFGCDHAEVGGAMARKWSFPEPITNAIERHHDVPIPSPDRMIAAVMLANLAAKSAGIGLGAAGMKMRVDYGGSRDRLGLTMHGFERACAQMAIWVAELRVSEGLNPHAPSSQSRARSVAAESRLIN